MPGRKLFSINNNWTNLGKHLPCKDNLNNFGLVLGMRALRKKSDQNNSLLFCLMCVLIITSKFEHYDINYQTFIAQYYSF